MIKKFEITGLDCAVCAGKVEDAINKIDGVNAKLSYVTEVLTISTEENIDEVMDKVKKTVKKMEPQVKIKGV